MSFFRFSTLLYVCNSFRRLTSKILTEEKLGILTFYKLVKLKTFLRVFIDHFLNIYWAVKKTVRRTTLRKFRRIWTSTLNLTSTNQRSRFPKTRSWWWRKWIGKTTSSGTEKISNTRSDSSFTKNLSHLNVCFSVLLFHLYSSITLV